MKDVFENQLREWESVIEMPYPQRLQLIREMEGDLHAIFDSLLEEGATREDAYAEAIKQFSLAREDLVSLREVHASALQILLLKLPTSVRDFLEFFCGMVPLFLFSYAIQRGVPIMDFIRDGGSPGMYVILLMGAFLLGRELIRTFKLIVIKDHTAKNLNVDTQSVFVGCVSLLLFAMAWTMMGLYATAESAEAQQNFSSVLVMGIKESLIPFVSGLFLCSLVMLAHYGTRSVLRRWEAPLN